MANNDKTEKILEIKVDYNKAINGIKKYRESIEEVRNAEKGLKEQLDKNDISQEEYNKGMEVAKAKIAEYNYAIRTLQKQLRNQIKQENEQKGSLRALRAELSNLTAEYDALSEMDRKSAIVGGELERKINNVTDAIKKAEEATQRYYRNVGNYENAIKNALGINNEFANSLLELASDGDKAGNLFDAIGVKARAFGKTLLSLMGNPVFLALAGIAGVGAAFKWFYDYNKGLEEATRLTRQFTGLAGNELKEFRNEVQSLADVYGKDFREVLQSVNSVAKQFEISQSEALETVRDGFIAGADASGQYLDILKEYPAYFNEAGISADQFVAIVTSATQQGIFSDKGIDAIKEANTRIREMTTATAAAFEGIGMNSEKVQEELQNGAKTTFDIIQEVSDRLKELPESSAAVGAALADIFGDPGEDAGLRYIKTLGDISTNLDEVKAKTGELGELQEELLESQTNLENALSGLFDMTGGGFEEITTKAKILINDELSRILNGIKALVDYGKDIYNQFTLVRGVLNGIALILQGANSVIEVVVKSLYNALRMIVTMIMNVIKFDWDGLKESANDFADRMVELGKNTGKRMAEAAKGAWEETLNGQLQIETADNQQQVKSDASGKGKTTGRTVSTPADASEALEAKKKEITEVRKMEDELLKLEKDSRKKQTQAIQYEYERQIEDLKNRLSTETDLTDKAREAIIGQIKALGQQETQALEQLSDENTKKEIENRQKLIEAQLASVEEGSRQEYDLKMKQLQAQRESELADKELTEEMKAAIEAKCRKQQQDLTNQFNADVRKKQQEEMRMRMENELLELQNSGASELEILQEQARQKQEIADSIRREDYESEVEYQNALLEARKNANDAKQELADKEVEIEQKKANAMAQITGAIGDLLELAGENNRSAAIAAKTLAIAEVAIQQGVAIANAVRAATQSSKTWWEVIANIASAVAAVVSTIASATKSIKSAKFASGGLVTGPGTGTSDSIPARLSNGESVMTARATEMFAPILSSFNMMGGGVPINVTQASNQALGEDMLARAVAKGVKNIRPVVSVEEITSVANRVEVLENLGNV